MKTRENMRRTERQIVKFHDNATGTTTHATTVRIGIPKIRNQMNDSASQLTFTSPLPKPPQNQEPMVSGSSRKDNFVCTTARITNGQNNCYSGWALPYPDATTNSESSNYCHTGGKEKAGSSTVCSGTTALLPMWLDQGWSESQEESSNTLLGVLYAPST